MDEDYLRARAHVPGTDSTPTGDAQGRQSCAHPVIVVPVLYPPIEESHYPAGITVDRLVDLQCSPLGPQVTRTQD